MKKLLNVILASFMVLGMIGCSNAAGDSQKENETIITLEGLKAEAGENGVVLTLPKKLLDAEKYTIGKYDCNTKEENYWLKNEYITFTDKSKESVIDYFVEKDHRYNYVLYCWKGKKKIAYSEVVEVTPTAGIGELVLNPAPKAEFNNNNMIFSQLPIVPEAQKEKLNKGFLGLVYVDKVMRSRTLVIDFSKPENFTNKIYNCSGKLNKDEYNKQLEVWGSQGVVTIDGVDYYRTKQFDTDVPKEITVTN